MALRAGERLGPYEILGAVGAGGMGEVYRARDSRLGRTVAIKVLPASVSSDPVRRARFEHEARATGLLNHPNILAVHDVGDHEGAPYLVAELLEGETLRERLQAGTVPVRKAVDYALQVTRGRAAATGSKCWKKGTSVTSRKDTATRSKTSAPSRAGFPQANIEHKRSR
jgi:serine/threonine protein kinase